jgi:hypothetical protein
VAGAGPNSPRAIEIRVRPSRSNDCPKADQCSRSAACRSLSDSVPSGLPACRDAIVSFQRSMSWTACGSSHGSEVPMSTCCTPSDTAFCTAASTQSNSSSSRIFRSPSVSTRPARLSIMISRVDPQCRT